MNQKIKISQLPAKGSNLAAADLLEIAEFTGTGYISKSITGQEIIDAIPAPSVDWGDIGGTLSDQTDLNTALSGKVPTSRTLTINGTTQDLSADRTFTISTGITIGTTAITSGTVGRVLFEGTGNVVQESANLFWDNTNGRLGIGTSSPSTTFAIGSGGINRVNLGLQAFEMYTPSSVRTVFLGYSSTSGQLIISSGGSNDVNFLGGGFKSISTGNFAIGSTTDAGFRLDVNGNARVSDNVLLTNGIIATSGATTRLQGSLNYFTHNRIASSGAHGFQISNYGTVTSFWRWDTGTYDLEIGSPSGALSQNFKLFTAGSERMRLTAGGNVLIGTTTDAGFRLDVNGTARVSNNGAVNVATFTGSDGSTIIDRYGNFYSQGLNATSGINGTGVVGLRINKTDGNGKDWRFEQNRNLTDGSLELGVSPWTNNIMTLRSTGVIGINTNAPNASAQLEVASTTRGFLPPRMTTTQKNAIASPATGLMVYDTTLNVISYYNGTSWI